MSESAYTYKKKTIKNTDVSSDILVRSGSTREQTFPFEIPGEEALPSAPKPRELNKSKKVRRDIKTLNRGYIRAPSSQLTIIDMDTLLKAEQKKKKKSESLSDEKIQIKEQIISDEKKSGVKKIVTVKKPLPVFVISMIFLVTILMIYMITLTIKKDKYNASVNELSQKIQQAQEDETALILKVDQKFNLADINRIARDEYGMVSADSLPKKYVSVIGEDEIEINDDTEVTTNIPLLSAFGELITDLLS